jgi:aspartyl-tRNA(Asn)/glutamyl-tRNA(Gln) amidotransferase subunit A
MPANAPTTEAVKRAPTLPRTIGEAGRMLREGSLSVTALVQASLDRARALQPVLNAFITITEEHALREARRLEEELAKGVDRGPLHGIPIVHKDCFDTAGIVTTRGSRFFAEHVPARDASVVTRLAHAGCVMVGKANMKELAAGGSGDNTFYGAVRNPWNRTRSAGGSSSGSAVAVAAGICLGATGADSGGSIRGPASWNGIVGVRPTPGVVSNAGCFPRSYSFDCAGPMARTVRDVAILLGAMAGGDLVAAPARGASLNFTAELGRDVSGARIGVIADYSLRDVDAPVAASIEDAISHFRGLGVEVRTVELPSVSREFDYRGLFDVLQFEFARILGPHYWTCPEREEMFGRFVHANMKRGVEVDERTYRAALADREAVAARMRACFVELDALLTPSQPFVAQPFAAPDSVFDRCRQFMLPFSFAGLPCISVPCGFDGDGLPIGLQLVCDRLDEQRMLALADAFAARTQVLYRDPPL